MNTFYIRNFTEHSLKFLIILNPCCHMKSLFKLSMDLTKEWKKLWNMKVMFIPIIIGALGTVTKGLLKGMEDSEIRGRVEIIQTTALLKSEY